jgi:hypothetical protein
VTIAWKAGTTAVLLTPLLMFGACGRDDSPEWSGAVKTETPVRTFAPMLNLHPDERLLPMPADAFVRRSRLRWSDGECGQVTLAREITDASRVDSGPPRLDVSRLAGRRRPYRHAVRRSPACRPAKVFASSDYTRPYDPVRDNTIALHEGFVLDLKDSARTGSRAAIRGTRPRSLDVPVYYDAQITRTDDYNVIRLTYSVLYGMERIPGPLIRTSTAHEGSWRWIRVLLRNRPGSDEYVPLAVRFGARYRYLPWRAVRKVGSSGHGATHPAIFVSRASHVQYPKPGRYPRPVVTVRRRYLLHDEARACPDCIAWRSWRSLRSARAQPWYGYGGAWGATTKRGGMATGLAPTPWGEETKEALLTPGKLE